jgi:hypothetical protein
MAGALWTFTTEARILHAIGLDVGTNAPRAWRSNAGERGNGISEAK